MGNGRRQDSVVTRRASAARELAEAARIPRRRRAGPKGGQARIRAWLSWVNWQSALYVFVLVLACVLLVPLTSFWWVVPLLGAAAPLALGVLDRSGAVSKRLEARRNRERELLEALAERGELTPTTAAMRTSLTVDEASKVLDDLAGKGHLKLRTEDGIMAYHPGTRSL